jgi:hypothetical protein
MWLAVIVNKTESGGIRAGEFSVKNRTCLAQLADMQMGEVTALPLAHVAMLLEDVKAEEARIKGLKTLLQDALDARFSAAAANERRKRGKDAGKVTLTSDGCRIVADLPADPKWDQALLAKVALTITAWSEPVDQYMTLTYKVSETAYKAWPESIRKVFEPARTLGVGKPSYLVEIVGEREAA